MSSQNKKIKVNDVYITIKSRSPYLSLRDKTDLYNQLYAVCWAAFLNLEKKGLTTKYIALRMYQKPKPKMSILENTPVFSKAMILQKPTKNFSAIKDVVKTLVRSKRVSTRQIRLLILELGDLDELPVKERRSNTSVRRIPLPTHVTGTKGMPMENKASRLKKFLDPQAPPEPEPEPIVKPKKRVSWSDMPNKVE